MYRRITKHLLDKLASIILLVIFSPILLITIVILAMFNKSDIFFLQRRPGENEKIFKLIKFCTMSNESDEKGNLLTDEERLTRIGLFLRKTSIDELPELINVLKGEMSLVGPRPLLESYLPYYTELEKKRHNVKPGITGLAQISGRNFIDWDNRLKLDVEYVNNISLKMDLKILLKTVVYVIASKDTSVNSAMVEPSLIDYRKNKNKLI